jgi:hypothetical protein
MVSNIFTSTVAVMVYLACVGIGFGQKINALDKPAFDEFATMLFSFDQSFAPQTKDKNPPAVTGGGKLVPGRFGTAAMLNEGGITLPVSCNSLLDANSGSIEFYFKADSKKWFYETHFFLTNNLKFCQAGYKALWYWSDARALRLDFHLEGDCGFIYCGLPMDTNWHHIAATWDSQKGYALYVDGVLNNAKSTSWSGMWIPPESQKIVIGGSAGECRMDEIRLSKTARTNPAIPELIYTAVRRAPRIENGRTMMTVGLNFTNQGKETQSVSADLSLIDYYQVPCGNKAARLTLKPGQSQEVTLDVPTDNAGPYIKIHLKGTKKNGSEKGEISDEKLVFVDTLAGPRLRFDLNGTWEMCDGDPLKLTLPGPQAAWKPVDLPHRDWTWNKVHTKWFRKKIVLPKEMQGKIIELKLSGVRFRADVFVNGRPLGGYDTDQMSLTIDITQAAKVGAENELLIAVTDWITLVPPELKTRYADVGIFNTGPGGNPFIRPHGTMVSPSGIVDPIFLVATDKISIDNSFITPSVRKSNLTIRTLVNNRTGKPQKVRLEFSMTGKGSPVLATQKEVVLKPGINDLTHVAPVDLAKVTLWQIQKPYLYKLQAAIQSEKQTLDQLDVRFGFREFWADGPVFRINGTPIKPVYTSCTPYQIPGFASMVDDWYPLKRFLGSCFNGRINLLRYHSKPSPNLFCDAADEVGLMVVSEAIHTTIPCAYNWGDERLWQAFQEYYPKWVFREFNHPCVVIRSMENELGFLLPQSGPGQNVGPEKTVKRTRKGMKNLGRMVKRLDPGRLIMYHGSGPNFYDVADIYNLHYPGLGNGQNTLAPISSRWITIPMSSYGVPNWLWDRKKPLFVGEHDCCLAPTPAFLAALLGNDAYAEDWQTLAFETLWPLSVENLRSDGVATVSPWNPLTPVIPMVDEKYPHVKLFKDQFSPVATYIREARTGYFGGKQINRSLTTLNDYPTAKNITVRWRLVRENGTTLAQEELSFSLNPAESKRNPIRLTLPNVDAVTPVKLIVDTLIDGKQEHTASRKFEIFPDVLPNLTLSARYGVLGLESDVWTGLKVPVKVLDPKSPALSEIDVLMISGKIAHLKGQEPAIEKFLTNGGRVIVFDCAAPPKYLPVKVEMVKSDGPISYVSDYEPEKRVAIKNLNSATTITFPRFPEHAIVKDLPAERLRYWREDHITAESTFVKPATTASHAIIDCGYGLDNAALLEVPYDQGLMILNQLPVLDQFDDQPAARILLGNLLRYVDGYRGTPAKPLGILADRRGLMTMFLEAMGTDFFCLSGRLDKIKNFSAYGAIVVEADEKNFKELLAHAEAVKHYVQAGGVVWIHRPKPEHVTAINKLLPVPVEIKGLVPFAAIRIDNRDLAGGIVNESLFWAKGSPPYCGPIDVRVATNRIVAPEDKNVLMLADPEVMVSMIAGQGRWLIDEVAWESEYNERQRAQTFVRPILSNLGLKVRGKVLEKKTVDVGFRAIDISKFCNAPLVGGIWGGSEMGIKKLPAGLQTFKGTQYVLVDPNTNGQKGCASFYAGDHNPQGAKEIILAVDRKAAGLNLLVASLWTSNLSVMTPLLNVDIEYADGTKVLTSVCSGRDVEDWYRSEITPEIHHPGVAWVGPEDPYPGLYRFFWENPNPEKVIRSVTLRAANSNGFVVLFAVSTQDRLPDGGAEHFVVPGTQ